MDKLMAKDLFFNLDLNLLKTFVILSQELNMRKASQRLFVSQPAISQSLQKLRLHFDDALFVKSPKGLTATVYADELSAKLIPILDTLSSTLNESQDFSPKDLQQTIKIALSPQVLCTLSGTLVQRIQEVAPNLDLHLLSWNDATLKDLCKGELHLAINYDYTAVPKEVLTHHLIDLNGVVIVRKDHPIKLKTARYEDFRGQKITSLIIPGWNEQESYAAKELKKYNIEFSEGFRSEFPMAILDVVQHTDMCFPTIALFPIDNYPNLRVIPLKLDESINSLSLISYFHAKNKKSPLILWLNTLIKTLLLEQQEMLNRK